MLDAHAPKSFKDIVIRPQLLWYTGVDLKTVEPRSFCEGCVQGKATKHKPKPLGEIHSTRRLEKVHSDVCGPMQTASNSGKKYMVTFVDDYSRTCAVYFMAHKSDTFANVSRVSCEDCRREWRTNWRAED